LSHHTAAVAAQQPTTATLLTGSDCDRLAVDLRESMDV
jgi:hypothetical protein